MKKIFLFAADQNKATHFPCMVMDLSFDDLCKLEPAFKTSQPLKLFFQTPQIKSVFIMLWLPRGGDQMNRRMLSLSHEPDTKEMKQIMTDMMGSIGVNATFHTKDEFKKIIPHQREDREMLKRMLKHHEWITP